jgi:restriction system protein
MLFSMVAVALILLALAICYYKGLLRHRWHRWRVRAMVSQLCGRDQFELAQLVCAELRAMDPLVFEKPQLERFERRDHKVVRNRRYIGDGAIDGHIVINGAIWLIRAKRYADLIRPEHVVAYNTLCQRRRRLDLFIRTGPRSRTSAIHSRAVQAIPGLSWLPILTGGPAASIRSYRDPAMSVAPLKARRVA